MKRLVSAFLAGAMALSLAACGGAASTSTAASASASASGSAAASQAAGSDLDYIKGKTRTEIAGLSGGDADLKALCTIDITDLQKAALDALS